MYIYVLSIICYMYLIFVIVYCVHFYKLYRNWIFCLDWNSSAFFKISVTMRFSHGSFPRFTFSKEKIISCCLLQSIICYGDYSCYFHFRSMQFCLVFYDFILNILFLDLLTFVSLSLGVSICCYSIRDTFSW